MDIVDDILHILSFLFTVIIILLGIIRGLNSLELVLNVLYFTILNATFIRYLLKTKGD